MRMAENDENAVFFSEKDGIFYFRHLYFVGALVRAATATKGGFFSERADAFVISPNSSNHVN